MIVFSPRLGLTHTVAYQHRFQKARPIHTCTAYARGGRARVNYGRITFHSSELLRGYLKKRLDQLRLKAHHELLRVNQLSGVCSFSWLFSSLPTQGEGGGGCSRQFRTGVGRGGSKTLILFKSNTNRKLTAFLMLKTEI